MREISPLAARRKGGGGPAGATRSGGRRLFTDAGVSQAENKRKRKAKLREQVKANNEWAKKKGKGKGFVWQRKYPDEPKDAPAKDETGWHHSIAVVDGKVRDWDATEPVSSLWLRKKDNRPDWNKGYMRSIRKVYVTQKCKGGLGCTGQCL